MKTVLLPLRHILKLLNHLNENCIYALKFQMPNNLLQ